MILATNVAETSLTIDGVGVVIDSGQARIARSNPAVGLTRVAIEPISQAAAEQRAGRAGRTAPGTAIRLWSKASHGSRPPRPAPEIVTSDLAATRLRLLLFGEGDLRSFPWLDPPPDAAIEAADRLLTLLGAIDDAGQLTAIGTAIARLPVHPRIGRMLIEASAEVRPIAAVAAAMIAERDPYRGVSRRPPANLWDRLTDWSDDAGGLDRSARRTIEKAADQFLRGVETMTAGRGDLVASLLAGFPDRVCRRRVAGEPEARMVGGRGVVLPNEGRLADAEYALALDVDDRDTNAAIRLAVVVDADELPDALKQQRVEHQFDEAAGAVRARRVTRLIDLVLDETPVPCRPGPAAGKVLHDAVVDDPSRWYPSAGAAAAWLARLRWLHRVWPDGDWPRVDDEQLRQWLGEFSERCVDVEQLRRCDWAGRMTAAWDYPLRQRVEAAAPTTLTLPRGRRPSIEYCEDGPPRVKTRIQDVFGVAQTPRLAGGRVAVQFHLTSPAGRVAQITDDLAGFWSGSYALVRKDLRGRYPKHDWPEDPRTSASRH